MKRLFSNQITIFLCLIAFSSVIIQGSCQKEGQEVKKAEAIIEPTNSAAVSGKMFFIKTKNKKVKLHLELLVPSRSNSSVAVHIHEHGMCGSMGGDAHGHWNPTNQLHGKWGSTAFHAGDIGNISLDSNGRGMLDLETDLWDLGGNIDKNILGRSIIVHGGVDDYSQPTGNSGPRIGCGVIEAK